MGEFVDSLDLPSGCGIVLKARRLNRKVFNESVVTWIPTHSVILTFRGQMLPNRVFSYHTSLPVETYNLPTIICLRCCRYGHVKSQCRSKPKCFKCSQEHTGDSCEVTKDNATCLYCTKNNFATDKECPEYTRQHSIKMLMSLENISYIEASARVPPTQRSYSEIAKEMFSSPVNLYPSLITPTSSPQTSSVSYKKAVINTPRPKSPLGKGFDKQAHQATIFNEPSSLPNGFALNVDNSFPSISPNFIDLFTKSLVNIFLTSSDSPVPKNVANTIKQIIQILQNDLNQVTSVRC